MGAIVPLAACAPPDVALGYDVGKISAGCLVVNCFRKCFKQLELLLVAVAVPSADPQQAARVILNPSGAGCKSSAAVIDEHMKGFFICQSQDDAKRVQNYCYGCHGNANKGGPINQCACADKGHRHCLKS